MFMMKVSRDCAFEMHNLDLDLLWLTRGFEPSLNQEDGVFLTPRSTGLELSG